MSVHDRMCVKHGGTGRAVRLPAPLSRAHGRYVHGRRVRILSHHLGSLIPPNAHVLDVGAGDGTLAQALLARRPDLNVRGVDVLVRRGTAIAISPFDGSRLDFDDNEFDAVVLVDVLHHARDPLALLSECRRVAPLIVIKDHVLRGLFAEPTLRFMDWVGNSRYGVALPYRYWNLDEWHRTFRWLRLRVTAWRFHLALYPIPARWWFERDLHFVARVERHQGDRSKHPGHTHEIS